VGHRTDRTRANLANKTTGLVAAVTLLVVCGAMALVDPRSVLKHGSIAFTYFNSSLNSTADWTLTGAKEEEFARLLRTTPTL